MKLQRAVFAEPMDLAFGRREKVIDMADKNTQRIFELELDARGFVRVLTKLDREGQPVAVVDFIGPAYAKQIRALASDIPPIKR